MSQPPDASDVPRTRPTMTARDRIENLYRKRLNDREHMLALSYQRKKQASRASSPVRTPPANGNAAHPEYARTPRLRCPAPLVRRSDRTQDAPAATRRSQIRRRHAPP